MRWTALATLSALLGAFVLAEPVTAQEGTIAAAIEAYEQGRFEEAERRLLALTSGPGEAAARAYLGRIHLGREEWDEAEEQLERAVELEPGNADFTYWLGDTYMQHIADVSFLKKRGQADKALRTLTHALELDPNHVDARMALAGYYLNAPGIAGGSKERARQQVDAIIHLDPKRGYLFEAEVHEDDEDLDAAWASYERALAYAPDDPMVLFRAGMFRQGREEWAEAVALLDRAAQVPITVDNRPFVRQALYQVGRTGALSGQDLGRSAAALREFIERFPEHEDILSAGAYWRLGMIYEMQGDLDAARDAYRGALGVDPEHEEATNALRKLGG